MVIGGDVESVVLGIMIDDETGSGTTRNEFTSFSHQVALDKDQKQLVRYVPKASCICSIKSSVRILSA